jgi:cytochrome c oxidase assembly protein subunit 15
VTKTRFEKLCWWTLAFVVFVILWGAFVRATGSGAGCGSHWPMCNGEVVPRSPTMETVIELTHRITSGVSALMVLVQLIYSRKLFSRGHRVRGAVAWSAFFMVVEVLIGAGIVLLEYVADNQSVGRAVWMAVHLINTFLLVAALTLSAHFASGGGPFRLLGHGLAGWLAGLTLVGTIVVGMSGAVAALGDTLFPADSLESAIAADMSPTAHVLVRLRVLHPFVAVGVAFLILGMRYVLASRREDVPLVQGWGNIVRILVVTQMALGLANLMLLAPTYMQIAHLLVAQLLWIALVLFVATALTETAGAESEAAEPAAA